MSTNLAPNFLGTELGVGGRTVSANPDNTDGSNVAVAGNKSADIIASRCAEEFEADALVQQIFGTDGVELWDMRPFFDFRNLPLLYITPSTTTDEQVPNQQALEEVELFFGVRYPTDSLSPRRTWEPGIASLVEHLKSIINTRLQTVEFFINDVCMQIGRSSFPGTFSPFLDRSPDGDRFAVTHEFSWIWRIRIDLATSLPVNVAAA